MSTLSDALQVLTPDAEYVDRDGTYANLEWVSTDITKPSESAVNTKVTELTNGTPLRLLREERDRRITETDWWASSDLTMTHAQIDYRQALRDITDNYSSLDTVVWPTKP